MSLRYRRVLAIAVVVFAASSGLAACDWTHPLAGPGRTGAAIGETTIGTSNVALLKPRWVQPAYSAPVVAGGVVYTQGDSTVETNTLQALDAASGQGKWRRAEAGAGAPDAVVNGRIYATGQRVRRRDRRRARADVHGRPLRLGRGCCRRSARREFQR